MNLEYLKQEKEKVMNGCGRNCGELNCGERYLSINLLFLCPSCEEKKEIYNKGIQAVENTIKDEIEFLKYIHLENATEEDIVKRLTQLQKQKEDMK